MSDTIEIIIREEGSGRKIFHFFRNLQDKRPVIDTINNIKKKYDLNDKNDWLNLDGDFFK